MAKENYRWPARISVAEVNSDKMSQVEAIAESLFAINCARQGRVFPDEYPWPGTSYEPTMEGFIKSHTDAIRNSLLKIEQGEY